MTESIRLNIPTDTNIRALTFIDGGQQMRCNLPPGVYYCKGKTEVEYSYYGNPGTAVAYLLVSVKTGDSWFVGITQGEQIREKYREPVEPRNPIIVIHSEI